MEQNFEDAVGIARLEQHYLHPRCDADLKKLRESFEHLQAEKVHEYHENEKWLLARRWDAEARGDHVHVHHPQSEGERKAAEERRRNENAAQPVGDAQDDGVDAGVDRAKLPHREVQDRRESEDSHRMKELHALKLAEHEQEMRDARDRLQIHADLRHGQMRRSEFLRQQRQLQQQVAQAEAANKNRPPPHFLDFVHWFDYVLLLVVIVFFASKFGFLSRAAAAGKKL
jgi:hypothetical protein